MDVAFRQQKLIFSYLPQITDQCVLWYPSPIKPSKGLRNGATCMSRSGGQKFMVNKIHCLITLVYWYIITQYTFCKIRAVHDC